MSKRLERPLDATVFKCRITPHLYSGWSAEPIHRSHDDRAAFGEPTRKCQLLATTRGLDSLPKLRAVRDASVDSRVRGLMHNTRCEILDRHGIVSHIP
jgi:hypothetical protein